MTPTSAAPLAMFIHDAVAVCAPEGGLATQKINERSVAVVPESVPGVRVPLTPVIVTVKVPAGVVPLVVTENVDDVVVGFGVKLPLTPAGNPLALNVTAPVKPLSGVIVTP